MFSSGLRGGFSKNVRVLPNINQEKMAAPNNAFYVLEQTHAGLPNSVVYQKVATGDSPTFADLEITGRVQIGGTIETTHPLFIKSKSISGRVTAIQIEEVSGTEGWHIGVEPDGSLGFSNSFSSTPDIIFSDDNRLGVNVGTSPDAPMHILGTGFPVGKFTRETTSTSSISSGYLLHSKTSGNMADGFGGGIVFSIQDNISAEENIATLYAIRDGADNSGAMTLNTYLNGTRTEKLRVDSVGDVKINRGQLYIDQNSTTGAKPVLILDQADISEEMIELVSTIGTGNAIEAIAAKTLTTTHFIKITIPGGLTRYIPCGTIA